MNAPKKKLYIKTYGCQMNVADSEQMALLLAPEYEQTSRPEEADLYLINTCSIRRKSEEKVRSLIGRLRGLKRRRPQMLLGVGGCVAQQEGARLLDQAPQVDLIFGTEGFYRLPQLISQRLASGKPVIDTAITGGDYYLCRQPAPSSWRKLVTIMQGCNNFCTYCVVPYVRGRERSRPAAEIVAEVAAFVAQGGKEVTLLGQNVNSYGRGLAAEVSFPELLRRLSRLEGLLRLRFTTSHPRDLSDELIACFGDLAPLCEHIHLPVQAGSNRILARMNRGYTREEYLAKVRRLRRACPGIAITTDLIVGFPGETEADFAATLDLMQEVASIMPFTLNIHPGPKPWPPACRSRCPQKSKENAWPGSRPCRKS